MLLLTFLLLSCLFSHSAPGLEGAEGITGKEVKAQIWSEQGLKKNNYYLSVINPAISNFGSAEEKNVYQHCVNHHLKSQILFLAFRFNKAYSEVRITQFLLIQLYEQIVRKSLNKAHLRLSEMAKRVLYGRDVLSRKYMALGMRDLALAEQKFIAEYNKRPWLYLIKLNDITDALKLIRHANRYYILLSLHFNSIYPTDTTNLSYLTARRLITSGLPVNREKMLLIHDDNYFRVYPWKKDLLQLYRENPDLALLGKQLPGWPLKETPRYR